MFAVRVFEVSGPPDLTNHDVLAVGQSCLCIGIDIAGRAPAQELIRIDIDPMRTAALRNLALEYGLGLVQPLVEIDRQQVAVGHDGADTGITIAVVPGNGDVQRLGHEPMLPSSEPVIKGTNEPPVSALGLPACIRRAS